MFGPRGAGSSRSSEDLHNEDAFLVADELGLYLVCDGCGDEPGGEVAARIAVDAISAFLGGLLRPDRESNPKDFGAFDLAAPVSCRTIEGAIRFALESIAAASDDRSDLEGMASTATLLLVQRGRAFVGHIGDSRAYLLRRADLVQLTTDQDWTASTIRRCIGDRMGIETFSLPTCARDTFILCTDGAEEEVVNAELFEAMGQYSPRLIASRLVAAAHRHRPAEDATVVVVRIREDCEIAGGSAIEPVDCDLRGRSLSRCARPRLTPLPSPYDHLLDRSIMGSPSRRFLATP